MTTFFPYVVQTHERKTDKRDNVAGFADYTDALAFAQSRHARLISSHTVRVFDQARDCAVNTLYPNPLPVRVTHYEGTAYYSSTGSSNTRLYAFNQTQASEIGAVLHADGLNIADAQRLCDKWQAMGNRGSIRYTYSLPIQPRKVQT